jgi:hypothetical protein
MPAFDPENPFGIPDLESEHVDRLHDHVEALCAEHDLQWREQEMSWLAAEGALGESWFSSPTLRNDFHYLVALHEIGHHVLNLSSDDEEGAVLFGNEVAVWEWALATSVIDPSWVAWEQARTCLETYPGQRPPPDAVERMRQFSPPAHAPLRWRG